MERGTQKARSRPDSCANLRAAADGKDHPPALRLPGENIFIPHLEVPERSPEEPTRSPDYALSETHAEFVLARTGQAPSHSQPGCAVREHDFGVTERVVTARLLYHPCLGLPAKCCL